MCPSLSDLDLFSPADLFEFIHVADRHAADLQANQLGVDVEDPADGKSLQIEVLVVGHGLTEVTGADDHRRYRFGDTDDHFQSRNQFFDLIGPTRPAETPEIVEIVA